MLPLEETAMQHRRTAHAIEFEALLPLGVLRKLKIEFNKIENKYVCDQSCCSTSAVHATHCSICVTTWKFPISKKLIA